ncbi:MAG: hypothetical protein ABH872_07685 [Candidatus Omnitrophota bacterium]
MNILRKIYSVISKDRKSVLAYLIIVNLPLLILTFDTGNWSDDYQYTNLIMVKAKFSPILPLIFDTTGGHVQGGHFAPFYNLINLLITSISLSPVFFHFIIMAFYILTAFFVFLIVDRYYQDKALAILAATLFALNYYIGFKALNWNAFHSHATNTLTGAASLYFLIRYIQEKKNFSLMACAVFLLLTIFNYESGFVFLPVLAITGFLSLLRKEICFRKLLLILIVLLMVAALFPLGAYMKTGKPIPLSYRFKTASQRWNRNIQGYAFNANDLFIKSTGFSIMYNNIIFNRLKHNVKLKEDVRRLIREGGSLTSLSTSVKILAILSIFIFLAVTVLIFVIVRILTRVRTKSILFLAIYGCLFAVYILVFYRTDIANAIALFSSVIAADLIICFLRSGKKVYYRIGLAALGFYFITSVWTVFDKFDDCYRKSFFGLSKAAIKGPGKIYSKINNKIGHFAEGGIIIFTHDYSSYHSTGGFERVGDVIGAGDLACFNAAVYYKDLLRTDIPRQYKKRPLEEFCQEFLINEKYRKVIVLSKEDALEYLKENNVDTGEIAAIYMSKDYYIDKLDI